MRDESDAAPGLVLVLIMHTPVDAVRNKRIINEKERHFRHAFGNLLSKIATRNYR